MRSRSEWIHCRAIPEIAHGHVCPDGPCPAFFEKGLASFPNAMETNPLIRYLVPSRLKKKLINKIMSGDSAKKSGVICNEVRRQYGLAPVYNYTALVKGDLTLLPDLPELSGLPADDLPKGYAYTGPVFATLSLPVPESVTRVFARPGLKIYLAMGSSGTPELLKKITKYLRCMENCNIGVRHNDNRIPGRMGSRFRIISMRPAFCLPIWLTKWRILRLFTAVRELFTAAWCGTPFVGIGMQWEQQANLDGLANAGMGIRIPLHSVTLKNLLTAVEKAASETYVSKAKQVQTLVRSWDGVQTAIDRMNRFAAEKMG